MRLLIKAILSAGILLSITVLLITFYLGKEYIVEYLVDVLNKPHKKEYALEFITDSRYLLIQAAILIFILLQFFLLTKVKLISPYVDQYISWLKEGIKTIIQDVQNKNAAVILIIPFVASIYFGFTIPISYDEAFTYILFTSKPFYLCLFYYPAPNNHVLHSVLTNITDCIPFISTIFGLRLPAIIMSLLLWIVTFSFVKRFYTEKTATFIVAISSVLFLSIYYSYMSRGYAMVTLFFVIALYSVYKIIKNGNLPKYRAILITACILGFYTIPTFLYGYVTLNAIWFLFNYRNFKTIVFCNIIIGIITLLLYAPIIIVNGFTAFFNNEFVERKDWFTVLKQIPDYIFETQSIIFGIPYQIITIIFIISGILLFRQNKIFEFKLWAIFGLAPLILLGVHSVIPFPRTFLYYGFIITFFFGISLANYLEMIPYKYILPLLLTIQLAALYNFKINIHEYESFNTFSKDINDRVIEEGKTYYMNNSLCIINHQFELASRGINYNEMAVYDWDTIEASADTITSYDYVIIDKETDETRLRKPFYSNEWQNVYKKE